MKSDRGWYLQHNDKWSVFFADNEDTAEFWELEEQYPNDPYEPNFPILLDDWHAAKMFIQQYIDNDLPDDENLIIVTKNGTRIYPEYASTKEFKKALMPFTEKHFAFMIYTDAGGYTMFWFNGWDGLLGLQEYTNWFDLDFYTDWI